MMAVMDIKDQVAVVTGASRGIGEAIAYELARNGAHVVVVARSTQDAPSKNFRGTVDETLANLREIGVDAIAVQGDVAIETDVERVRQETLDHFGRCDILVNNAAASYLAPFLELSVKRWDIVQNTNLRGPMLLAKAFVPGMIERGHGHVINISSADGRLDMDEIAASAAAVGSNSEASSFGEAGQELTASTTAYGTSKAGLNRFTVGLARELRDRGVAVNALEVSAVTEPVRLNLPNADLSMNEMPEAPAQLVVWLAKQPTTFTGRILAQPDLLADLRAQGIVRPKVDPT
jgi:NAD(P)-dependent dehydrogenase (short-subunit alcohol dehydrogenase family)